MANITRHSKERIVERTDVTSFAEAKRLAKQAKTSGKTINAFVKYPRFFSYLQNKRHQTNDCSIRVYQGCIYIWRGKSKSLVTAHTIPDRYIKEMEEIDNGV
jgi:protoheme ferro-lyase